MFSKRKVEQEKNDVMCNGYLDGVALVNNEIKHNIDLVCVNLIDRIISYEQNNGKYRNEYFDGLIVGVFFELNQINNFSIDQLYDLASKIKRLNFDNSFDYNDVIKKSRK